MAAIKGREASGLPRVARLYKAHALAAPGANTTFGAFSVSEGAVAVRITVCLTTGSVLNLTHTDGTTAYVSGLNASTALNAGDIYTFTVACMAFDQDGAAMSYGFQVETDSVVRTLIVDEVVGAVV